MHYKQKNQLFNYAFHWLGAPILAVALTLWPTLLSGLSILQTDPGDTLLNHYFLEHAYQHVRDGQLLNPDHFWSPQYFWPIKDTLTWSDHLIGPAFIYGALRQIFVDPYNTYVAWISLTLFLNYISLRKALKTISPKTSPTWLSIITIITAYSPAITIQLGHPQLLSLYIMGPILVLCNRLLRSDPIESFSISDWLILGFWLLSNGIFNIYLFVYGCYGALISIVMHCVRRVKTKNLKIAIGRNIKQSIVLFSIAIVINAVIYSPYFEALHTFGKRPMREILDNLPKPASWLYSSDQWLLPALLGDGRTPDGWISGVEQQLFPGWLLLVLFAAAIITALRKHSRSDLDLQVWITAVAGMILGTITIMDVSLWPIISRALPGAGSLRASSRVGIVIILFSAPCLAFASNHWKITKKRIELNALIILGYISAFISILATNPPSFALSEWKNEYESISSKLKSKKCEVFWLEWPDNSGKPWRAHVQAMHIQQKTNIPTINGLSGQFPKHHWPYDNPSGDGAYAWIGLNEPTQYHRVRQQTDSIKRCVARWNQSTQEAEIREIRTKNNIPLKLDQSFSFESKVYEGNQINIIKDNQDRLFISTADIMQRQSAKWLLLKRDGRPISANRGNYRITNARLNGNVVLIEDTNLAEGIQYLWRVDTTNGTFIDQTMRTLGETKDANDKPIKQES